MLLNLYYNFTEMIWIFKTFPQGDLWAHIDKILPNKKELMSILCKFLEIKKSSSINQEG